MRPHYLSFPDAATAQSALVNAGLAAIDKQFAVTYASGVDVIGGNPKELDQKSGCYDAQTKQPVYKTNTGYLVNVIVESLPPELAQYEVFPKTPMRVFAGHSPEEVAAREGK